MINLTLNRKGLKTGRTKILQNDTTATNEDDIAEAFNNCFTDVAIDIFSELPRTGIDFTEFLGSFDYK